MIHVRNVHSAIHRSKIALKPATATTTTRQKPTVSISTAHLPEFPPKEFKKNTLAPRQKAATTTNTDLSPDTWASLQPPPPTALSAFAHRVGLTSIFTTPSIIQQACTHPSFLPFYRQHHPNTAPPPSNDQLSSLGNALLGLFAAEYVHASYPHLPTRVLKAAVSAHVGPVTCASIAHEMGATQLLRWHRTANTPTTVGVLHADALASIPRAIVALVYQHRCLLSARKFTNAFFFSREIDLRNMLKFRDPKRALLETVAKFKRERPKSRLLKETGRFSNSPIFVVGIYSGADQLGEGFGSSLKMAEYRAAEDALHRLYLTRTPPHLLRIPTSTFSSTVGNVFRDLDQGGVAYVPGELGEAEVLFGSSGRSGAMLPLTPMNRGSKAQQQQPS